MALIDILFVRDESGSMVPWLDAFASALDDIDAALAAKGFTSRQYGICRYGNFTGTPAIFKHLSDELTGTEFYDLPTLVKWWPYIDGGGCSTSPDSYAGVYMTMNAVGGSTPYTFRAGSTKVIILLTDTDRESTYDPVTKQVLIDSLIVNGATLHVLNDDLQFECTPPSAIGMGRSFTGTVFYVNGATYGTCTGEIFGSSYADDLYADLAFKSLGSAWDLDYITSNDSIDAPFANALAEAIPQGQYASAYNTQNISFYQPFVDNVVQDNKLTFEFTNLAEYGETANPFRTHFRATFYADRRKQTVVYSAFSLVDQKRWYVMSNVDATLDTPLSSTETSSDVNTNDFYAPLSSDGVLMGSDIGVRVAFVPEVLPSSETLGQRTLMVNRTNLQYEKPLLCGVTYYVDIEAYHNDAFYIIESIEFQVPCRQVYADFWGTNSDNENWICSGQGKTDLRVSSSYGYFSVFPWVVADVYGNFDIIWSRKTNNVNDIYMGYWDSQLDVIHASGQGNSEVRIIKNGGRSFATMDIAQDPYVVSPCNNNGGIYKSCRWVPTITSPTTAYSYLSGSVYPGDQTSLDVTSQEDLKMRVYLDDVDTSIVINEDKTMPVVAKRDIRLDVQGMDGVYAIRLRNSNDTNWSSWFIIENQFVQHAHSSSSMSSVSSSSSSYTGFSALTPHFIDQERFLCNWRLPAQNGIQRISCQLLTWYGTTNVMSLDVLANFPERQYAVKLYSDIGNTHLLPTYNNKPVVSVNTGNKITSTTATIYVKIILNQSETGTLTFNVIQQGLNDQYGLALNPEAGSTTVFTGSFIVTESDGIYNKDGTAVITVNFPEDSLNLQITENNGLCISNDLDDYNRMNVYANQKELRVTGDVTPQTLLSVLRATQVTQVTDLNTLKQMYDKDDPKFIFGNKGYFIK